MYTPDQFNITDTEEIKELITKVGFGQLISLDGGHLCVSHIPMTLSNDGQQLLGHLAKTNPQWQGIHHQQVLVTFSGPHGYISPSWYTSSGVPTWNYQAAHVYGICRVFEEEERLASLVAHLTQKYEADREQPWEPDYPPSMLRGIVGLEVAITGIQCKYKLSQNRSQEDQRQIIDNLQAEGNQELVGAMKRYLKLY